jgi:ATP-dependent Clp protease adapter protein ClpS
MAEQTEQGVAAPHQEDGSQNSTGMALAAPARKPVPAKPKPRQLSPYKVLLHNDDVNDIEHVVKSIIQLTHLSQEAAVERTLEAHLNGLSLLLVTHKERAELYAEQFASLSLTVTIEPDA